MRDATTCTAFYWIGQDFAHCDNCGRDIRNHEGLHWRKPGALFSDPDGDELLPFDEAMRRIPMFAHFATPMNTERPYRWERPTSVASGGTS